MCGRFILDLVEAQDRFKIFGIRPANIPVAPRWNIAPSQNVAAVIGGDEPHLEWVHWGLVPSWAKDKSIGARMINARSETLLAKPAFRGLIPRKRCIIPATGFYEWKTIPGERRKQPMRIGLKSGDLFGFAGLWDEWTDRTSGEVLRSCTIITTEPNALMAEIHNRMPVILPPELYPAWLGSKPVIADVLNDWLKPYPADLMTAVPVSTLVNNPRVDRYECALPLFDGAEG